MVLVGKQQTDSADPTDSIVNDRFMKTLSLDDYSEFRISFGTHPGMTGKNNEDFADVAAYDANYSDDQVILYLGIVADGVGGQSAGERASRLATETIINYFTEIESVSIDNILIHLNKSVVKANNIVIEEAEHNPEFNGMATTIAIVAVLEGLLFTSHVGDSRIYMMRNKTLHQLSSDHSWVQEALEAGIISTDEARTHPNRNVIRRSLGTLDTVIVDQVMMSSAGTHFWQGMPLRENDLLLICSDGLTDMITPPDVLESLLAFPGDGDLEQTVNDLIEKANEAGGKDNITTMLIKTGPEFRHNKVMPIPPPVNPVYHLLDETTSVDGTTEQITQITHTNATNFTVTVGNNNVRAETNHPQAVQNPAVFAPAARFRNVKKGDANGEMSQEVFQRMMIRVVLLLAGIATILLAFVVFFILRMGG